MEGYIWLALLGIGLGASWLHLKQLRH
jgi:hypothetical protein